MRISSGLFPTVRERQHLRALAPGAAATDPQVRRLFRYLALLGTVCLLVAMALLLITTAAGLIDVAVDYHCSWCGRVQWLAGALGLAGVTLGLVDLLVLLPVRRAHERRIDADAPAPGAIAVALTCYNDEGSIAASVRDSRLTRGSVGVIVVDNASSDGSVAAAAAAGARVVVETRSGYGHCVHRCLRELAEENTDFVALCEGDMTFRARDLDKLAAFAHHADIVNGTRIVEQLRAYDTQLNTFMYYGNFFVGKLLEFKHVGKGTFTDVGTTYKLLRRDILAGLLPRLDPDHQPGVQRLLHGPGPAARLPDGRVPDHVPPASRGQQGRQCKHSPRLRGGHADDRRAVQQLANQSVERLFGAASRRS